MKVAILPRDGIGTEIVDEVMRVLNALDFRLGASRHWGCQRESLPRRNAGPGFQRADFSWHPQCLDAPHSADLPTLEHQIRIRLVIRCFYCRNSPCPRRAFS